MKALISGRNSWKESVATYLLPDGTEKDQFSFTMNADGYKGSWEDDLTKENGGAPIQDDKASN